MSNEKNELEISFWVRNMRLVIRQCGDPGALKIIAGLFQTKGTYVRSQLVFTHAPNGQCRIAKDALKNVTLWIGGTAFEIDEKQVDTIKKAFNLRANDSEGNPL